jgi:hypothetical protein
MYKQFKKYNFETKEFDSLADAIIRLADNASIPFDPANTDYQTFKKEVLAGAELLDADGNTMTTEEANAFIGTLS